MFNSAGNHSVIAEDTATAGSASVDPNFLRWYTLQGNILYFPDYAGQDF